MARMTTPGKIITLLAFVAVAVVAYNVIRKKAGITDKTGNIFSSSSAKTILTISGSHVMADELAPKLAKKYMEENGYTDVQVKEIGDNDGSEVIGTINNEKEMIVIQCVGNAEGVAALNSNKADIAISTVEVHDLKNYNENEIGLDALGIIVSPQNKDFEELDSETITNVFAGTDPRKPNLYILDRDNEYYQFFDQEIMGRSKISSTAQVFTDERKLIEAVSNDPRGIGFVDYEFIGTSKIKIVPIKEFSNYPSIYPNDVTVQSEQYPLSMRIYMYSQKSPTNSLVDKFLEWIESDEGQDVVDDAGFINFDIEYATKASAPMAEPNDPPQYTQLISSAKMIATEFRFQFGGSELDTRAHQDIKRIVKFLKDQGKLNSGLILVGFTDNIGDPGKNMALSVSRANTLKDELIHHGLKVDKVIGLGPARPVRKNDTEDGRAENRRVEVWVAN